MGEKAGRPKRPENSLPRIQKQNKQSNTGTKQDRKIGTRQDKDSAQKSFKKRQLNRNSKLTFA